MRPRASVPGPGVGPIKLLERASAAPLAGLSRSNLTASDPAQLWQFYLQLVEVEAAFKSLKDELAIRPIFHQREDRIEAHIFVAFLAYCLHVTLRQQLKAHAVGFFYTGGGRRPELSRQAIAILASV